MASGQDRLSMSSSLRLYGTTVTGMGKAAFAPGDRGNQRSRTFLGRAGSEHQDGDVLVLLDQRVDLLDGHALADYRLGLDARLLARIGRRISNSDRRFFAVSIASARITCSTPSQCWKSARFDHEEQRQAAASYAMARRAA